MAKDDAAGQLGIQQQINKVLQQRDALLANQQKMLTGQVQTAIQLCKALECKDLDQVAARLDDINSGLKSAAENAQAAADGQAEIGAATEEAGKAADTASTGFSGMLKNITATKAAGVGAASGIVKGFKSAGASVMMAAETFKTAAAGLMNIGKSIVSIPFKILGGLTSMAASGGGGVSAMAQATEKLRGEFGSLASNEGKAVMDGFSDLTSAGGALAQTGLSVGQVFGRGSAGMAAALEAVAEVARAAGGAFSMLKDSIAANAGVMVMMNKGLGMTNEALAEMTRKAQNAGKDVGDMLTATASMAIQMGEKFGVSGKVIGKNMSALTEDIANFGNMSVKQLGATATYMAKLGIEAKDLQGVIGKFDNFEDAAGSVSQLNQAFGMQLDTMEMMNAENPAERIDMMRDAFNEAGKSVEDMTRQEKALLAEQMGLSVSAMENALAAENQGVSYEDLEAGAEDAEANALSQEEAMSKLADSIEKMTEGGGGGVEGFFDAFSKGFMKGLKDSKEFQAVLKAIRAALKIVFQFGKQVGKMFADLMGDMGVWEGIKDLFDPTDLRNLLGINEKGGLTGTGLLGIFKKFKDALSGKGTYSPQQMAEDMGKEFSTFFSAKGPAFKKLKEAFIKGIQMIGTIIAGLIPFVIGKMVDLINGLADALANPQGLGDAASTGIGGAIVTALMGIGDALMQALPSLIGALINLLKAAATNPTVLKIGAAMMAFTFGKMMLMGAIAAAKAALFQVVVAKISKMMTGGVDKAAKKASKGKGAKSMGKSFKKGFSDFADGLKTFVKKIGKIKPADIMKAAGIMALMALSFLPALAIMALGLVIMVKILMMVPMGALIASVIAMRIAMEPLSGLIKSMSKVKPGQVGKAMLGAVMGAAFLVVGMLAFAAAVFLVAPIISAVGVGNFIMVGLVALAIGAAAAGLAVMMPSFSSVGALASALGMAMLGALAGALLLVVGVVAFSLAVAVAAPIVKAVGVGNFFLVALAMVAVAIAAVSLTIAAVALAAGIVLYPLGAIGAVMAAVMFFALATVTLPALAIFQAAMSGVGFLEIGLAMVQMLVVAWGAVFLALPFILGIAVFALGTVGAILAAAFVGIGLSALALALMLMQALYSGIDLPGAAVTLGLVTMVMGLIIITALMAAVVAALTPVMIIGGIGLLVAAAFIGAVSLTVAPALQLLMAAMKGIDGKELIYIAIGIELAFNAIIRMATRAKRLVKYLFPGMMKPIRAGFGVVNDMGVAMVSNLVPALKMIAQMPIGDPKLFMMKIDALLKIFGAIQDMGDLVYKIAMLDVLASSGGGESGAILEGAAGFINAIFGGAKDLILSLVKMLSVMKEGDIAKLEAVGGVLTAIGNLLQAMQPPPGLMDAIADISGGGLFGGGDPEGAAALLKTYGDMMGMIMMSVKDNIPPMVKSILEIDIGDDPEMAKIKAEVIGAAVSAVAKLIEAVGGIAQLFMEQNASEQTGFFYKSGPSMGETIAEMMPLFKQIFGMIKGNLPAIIKAVIEAVPDDIDQCSAEAKIKIVAGAMEAVANMASAIGEFSKLIPEDTSEWWHFGQDNTDPLEEMMSTVGAIVDAVIAYLPPLIQAVLSIPIEGNPCDALMKLEVIGKAMDAVSNFASLVSGIGDSGDISGFANTVSQMMWEISHAIWYPGNYDLSSLFTTLADNGAYLSDTSSLSLLDNAIATLCKLLDFASTATQLSAQMEMFASAEGGGFATAVADMVREVNYSLWALSTLAPIDAQVALDSFTGALGTGNNNYTISTDPVNITLNVQVTMDANKVGRVLVDKSVMTTPLAAAGAE